MARSVEMVIAHVKWIHPGDGRLQEFRIRFSISNSYPGETLCQQLCERMIPGQMLFDTRLVGNEDHKKLRMMCFDRLLQLFQERKRQFDAPAINVGHDDVSLHRL